MVGRSAREGSVSSRLRCSSETLGAAAPIDHLRLVDLVAQIGDGGQARRVADRAVDVDRPSADAADEVVMVVSNPVLEARRRPGGLDASEEALVGQDSEGVVHRLARDGADLGPHDLSDLVRRAVRSSGHRPQDGQTLGRDLEAVPAEKVGWIGVRLHGHESNISPILDSVKM